MTNNRMTLDEFLNRFDYLAQAIEAVDEAVARTSNSQPSHEQRSAVHLGSIGVFFEYALRSERGSSSSRCPIARNPCSFL